MSSEDALEKAYRGNTHYDPDLASELHPDLAKLYTRKSNANAAEMGRNEGISRIVQHFMNGKSPKWCSHFAKNSIHFIGMSPEGSKGHDYGLQRTVGMVKTADHIARNGHPFKTGSPMIGTNRAAEALVENTEEE
jgi:hypothetical protein